MENYNPYDTRHQRIRDKYQKNVEELTDAEKHRKEKHGATKIIFFREITPIQMFQNVMDNTSFIFRNRVLDEGKKVIKRQKGIKSRRILGKSIQWLGVLIVVLSLMFARSIGGPLTVVLFIVGTMVLPLVGGNIRILGRKYYFDYYIGPGATEINHLQNGQLAIINYVDEKHTLSNWFCALKMDDTESHGSLDDRSIPSYFNYIYIIDSVKSCTRTNNGLMIESSGRYYGERAAYYTGDNDLLSAFSYMVLAEAQISYRKEEMLAIFTNMDQLEALLMSYKDYQVGRDAFVPYGSGINIQGQER